MEQIKELQNLINKHIYNLNLGGCGRFAYYFYKKYKDVYDIKIVANDKDINDSIKNVEKCLPCNHVFVEIKYNNLSIFFDGYGFQEPQSFVYYPFDNLKKAIKTDKWNEKYNKNQDYLLRYLINGGKNKFIINFLKIIF